MNTFSPDVLNDIFSTILERKGNNPKNSYTASLFVKGKEEIARKLGEEAIETITAYLSSDDNGEIVKESADLLYHLLVLWAHSGITPEEIWEELSHRRGVSGIQEKLSRP